MNTDFISVHPGGQVLSINRLLDDWDLELTWDHPSRLILRCHARHFSSGLRSTKVLASFFTVQENEEEVLRVSAKIRTSSTDDTGRPERDWVIDEPEMVPQPVSRKK